MSISKGAFGQSAKGAFIESAMGARGWGANAVLWVATTSFFSARIGIVALDANLSQVWSLNTVGATCAAAGGTNGRLQRDLTKLYVPMVRGSSWEGSSGTTASVLALNLNTGAVAWTADTGSLATSTAVSSGGVVVVVGARNSTWPGSGGSNASVWAYDAADGSLLWTYDTGATTNMCVFDSAGYVQVVGNPNTTTSKNMWRLDPADGSLNASLLIDADTTAASIVTCIDVEDGPMTVVRPKLAPSNDLFEVPIALGAASSSSQKFNGFGASPIALDTSPFSCLVLNSSQTVLRIEAGTTVDTLASGLGNTATNACRSSVADEWWVTSSSTTTNLAKIIGATLDSSETSAVTFNGNSCGVRAIVQTTHWNF